MAPIRSPSVKNVSVSYMGGVTAGSKTYTGGSSSSRRSHPHPRSAKSAPRAFRDGRATVDDGVSPERGARTVM